jgi:hypothetical protein
MACFLGLVLLSSLIFSEITLRDLPLFTGILISLHPRYAISSVRTPRKYKHR